MMTQATKPAAKWWGGTEPTGKITIDEIATLLDLPTWEQIDELNQEHYWEMAGTSEDDDPEGEARMARERTVQDEVFASWHGAVMHAAETLFSAHGLDLEPLHLKPHATGNQALAFEFRITPKTTWDDAAIQIMTTIEGVGMFGYNGSLKEFLASGPYTARRAVLRHPHYVKRYPDVYGSASVRSIYEGAWRS